MLRPEIVAAIASLGHLVPVLAVDPLVDLGYTQLQGAAQQSGVTQWLGVPYATPPLTLLRFAAPIDPPETSGVQDATEFKPICMPRNPSDFTMQPNERFTVDEDCLYVNIFAPSNATAESKLPVMYFVQGGGFQSNSNANFNCGELAGFGDMVVVQVNYRVGPFGFLQSREVQQTGSLNNGLKDIIQGLNWLKQNVGAFGGDPEHIVMTGDSAGATAIALILAAFADEDPGLFKGVIMESVSVATLRTLEQGQEQYECLTRATGCDDAGDTLACLRGVGAEDLQTEDCQFNPHIDDDLVKAPMLTQFEEGRYLKVPTIAGTCTDEGTKGVPQDTDTTEDAIQFVNNQASGALSDGSLGIIQETYIDVEQPVFPESGQLWRQLANAHGDFRAHCITAKLQDAQARDGVLTWNYRYGVLDPEQEELGFGAYHTVELNGVFGPNNTDGAPPESYFTTNAPIVPLTMAYWASFVRTLDPNAAAIMDGMPMWEPWTVETPQRLLFQTDNTVMEVMPESQRANCEMLNPMLPAIESPMQPGTVELVRVDGAGSAPQAPPADGNEPAVGNGEADEGQSTVVVGGGTAVALEGPDAEAANAPSSAGVAIRPWGLGGSWGWAILAAVASVVIRV